MSLQVEQNIGDAHMDVEDMGLNEIRLKIEALEAKNQMLDGKLENMQLKAQILVLEAAKQKKQQEILKHFEEIAFQMAEFEKKLASLESKNDAIGQICKDAVASFEGESRVQSFVMPKGNMWDALKTKATILEGGISAHNSTDGLISVFGKKSFPISIGPLTDTIFYFEVHVTPSGYWNYFIGLSDGGLKDGQIVGEYANSYAIADGNEHAYFSGECHKFDLPNGVPIPKWNESVDVVGCGLLRSAKKKCQIFFTLNGNLLGKQCDIAPSVDCLYPTVTLYPKAQVKANFGGGGKAQKWSVKEMPCPFLQDFFE